MPSKGILLDSKEEGGPSLEASGPRGKSEGNEVLSPLKAVSSP